MRTNKFIPFMIALFLHAIPLGLLALKKTPSTEFETATPSSHSSMHEIDLSGFSLSQKGTAKSTEGHSKKSMANETKAKPTNSVGHSNSNSESTNGEGAAGAAKSEGPFSFVLVIEPLYPPVARQRGLEGKVKAMAFYNNEGIVTKVEITESSGVKMLDEAVINAVNEWRLKKGSSGSFEKSFEFKLKN